MSLTTRFLNVSVEYHSFASGKLTLQQHWCCPGHLHHSSNLLHIGRLTNLSVKGPTIAQSAATPPFLVSLSPVVTQSLPLFVAMRPLRQLPHSGGGHQQHCRSENRVRAQFKYPPQTSQILGSLLLPSLLVLSLAAPILVIFL